MCYDHAYEELPPDLAARLMEMTIPVRCLPALGVHEHCEHNLARIERTFDMLADRLIGHKLASQVPA